MSALEMSQMLTMSTGHLTADTCNDQRNDTPMGILRYQEGFVIPVPPEDWEAHDKFYEGLFRVDLIAALDMARALGADWVRFDADGPEVRGLCVHHW